ncbi:sugar-transfer associated ATP-grasp domain-containing protein [Natronococcus sp. A-GB7]|uniref:sugar-transfer associated ATP-grasp domain-containing protein n=1 Tax=Natronococcus sp. A-GB7 TaxID=3037649 RepID=UPI00241CAE49|nr:sugar-transfer associated ATP-grasp domain-containing protein [Natronococcus sp. A-GB7]MDG5820188.1 sugar-transfer associated ATP-grasp domain-containing protein [Natronococcus sp. A-GB7]
MGFRTAKSIYKRSSNSLEAVQRNAWAVGSVLNADIKSDADLPISKRLDALQSGFTSESYALFELDRRDRSDYLSDWERARGASKINKGYEITLDDKLLSHRILSPEYGELLPDLYGCLQDGEFVEPWEGATADCDSLIECVRKHKIVVIKPRAGTRGKRILFLQYDDGFLLDGEPISETRLTQICRNLDGYLATEVFHPAQYANEIHPSGFSTVRAITMVDPDTGKPFIGGAMHRFSTDKSAPLDNYAAGGGSAGIDRESGELSHFVIVKDNGRPEYMETHPDTGTQVLNVEIPAWSKIRTQILELADAVSSITPYLGLDLIVLDDKGSVGLIEANSLPGVQAMQAHKPLLRDDRNRRFYEYHGAL